MLLCPNTGQKYKLTQRRNTFYKHKLTIPLKYYSQICDSKHFFLTDVIQPASQACRIMMPIRQHDDCTDVP